MVDSHRKKRISPLFDNNAHNPLPLILSLTARNQTCAVNKAPLFAEQVAPAKLRAKRWTLRSKVCTSPYYMNLRLCSRMGGTRRATPGVRTFSDVVLPAWWPTSSNRIETWLPKSAVTGEWVCVRLVWPFGFLKCGTYGRIQVGRWCANVVSKNSTGTGMRWITIPLGPAAIVQAFVRSVHPVSRTRSRTRSVRREALWGHRTREVEKLKLRRTLLRWLHAVLIVRTWFLPRKFPRPSFIA